MQEDQNVSRGSDSKTSRISSRKQPKKPPSLLGTILKLLLAVVVIVALAAAGIILMNVLNRSGSPVNISLSSPESSLNPVEAAAVGAYLAVNQEALQTPVDRNADPEYFNIESGEHAAQIADDLVAQGIIADATLFRRYLSYHGLDVRLEAGTYELSASMTIPEIAYQLTDAAPPEITVTVPEGWRREQIAAWIDQQPDLPFTGSDFLIASGPGAAIPEDITFAADIPSGMSLEGFLFPDTYRLAIDATAQDLVERMLYTFDARVTGDLRQQAAANGLSLYQAVTVASIVEREARVADERPTIADVYLNRLEAGMKLEADPTVQYAMGYQADADQWWNLNLTQEDYYAVDSPYNTYLYPGLPPGPIANPGLSAIQAVLQPDDTPYLYFRATCDDSGRHNFATTFEEHVANACP